MKHILVVEDNEDVRKVVTTYLFSNGYRVSEAADGLAGYEMAISIAPDLILYDVLLPKLDGIESLKRLRKTPQGENIPVVMMSAVLQTRDLQSETSRLNVAGFLQKPFQVRTLLQTIKKVLSPPRNETSEKQKSPQYPRESLPSTAVPQASTSEPKRLVAIKEELPTRGTLNEFSLPKIIHNVFAQNLTGRIRIVSGTTEKRIYFQNGFPVYAESSIPEETLGAYLVHKKKITLQNHITVQAAMKETGRHYGEELLKTNILGPHELFMALESHLTEKVVSTFAWTEGQFLFEPGDSWKDDVIIARMKPGRIIIDGIKRCWTAQRIRSTGVIVNNSRAFVLEDSPYHDDQMSLSTVEARILQIAAREDSVGGILSRVKDKEMVVQTLFAFYIIGKVGFVVEHSGQVLSNSILPSPPAPSIPPSASKDERAQALMSEYIKYRTADYFKLLGVTREATDEEIRKGFDIRQRRYHPDTLIGIDTGLVHEKMEELYIRIHNAYRTLIYPAEKQKYIDGLEGDAKGMLLASRTKTGKQTMRLSKKPHEACFENGFSLLRNGEYTEALSLFREAEQQNPKVKYSAFRAWTEFLVNPDGQAAKTESELRTLFHKNKDEALLPYLLGNFYVRQKNSKEAESFFERALRIDPQNIDSQRQLRILRMRKQTETSGLFDLFKLKK